MSKRLWALPVLAALLVAGRGVGYAIPSLGGPTGVVSTPNALVAPMGQLQVAVSYQSMTNSLVSGLETYTPLDDSLNVWSLQALAGVAEGAELWAAYSKDSSDFDVSTWGIGGKYKFPTEASYGMDFAIGASYQAGSGDTNLIINIGEYELPDFEPADVNLDANATKVYGVVTKDFAAMAGSEWCPGSKLLGSLGVLYEKLNADLDATGLDFTGSGSFDESLFRPFVAVQWISADNVYLGLEYRWEDDDLDVDPVFSAVLGGTFAGGWTGEIGTTNADQFGLGLDDQNWFARVGYNFAAGAGW